MTVSMTSSCAKVGTIRPCLFVSVLPVVRFSNDELFLFSNFIPTGTVSWRVIVQASISLDQP